MATTSSQPNPNQTTINLSKIECIPPKNTIATINQFILNTTDFINRFAYFSEDKMLYLDQNIEKLEKKLETIPDEYFSNINTQLTTQTSNVPDVINTVNTVNTPSNLPPPPPPPPSLNLLNITQNSGAMAPPPLNLLLSKNATNTTTLPPLPPQLNNAGNNTGDGTQQGSSGPLVEEEKQEEKKDEFPGNNFCFDFK